jgi:hypothetical protein
MSRSTTKRATDARRAAARRAAGLCTRCGNPPTPGYRTCDVCRSRNSGAGEIGRRRRAAGLCRCGRKATPNYASCAICRVRAIDSYRPAHGRPPRLTVHRPHHCGFCGETGHNVLTCTDPRGRRSQRYGVSVVERVAP